MKLNKLKIKKLASGEKIMVDGNNEIWNYLTKKEIILIKKMNQIIDRLERKDDENHV